MAGVICCAFKGMLIMYIEDVRDQARLVLEKFGINTINVPISDLTVKPSRSKFYLLDVIDCDGPDVIELVNYDDCNRYQEKGFYVEELNKIDQQENNSISVKNIQESWDEKGNVLLSFLINGKSETLNFNHLEEKDNVPFPFVDYVNKLLTGYDGDSKFIMVREEYADLYILLPHAAIESLKEIEGINIEHLGFDGSINESEHEFEYKTNIKNEKKECSNSVGVSVRHSKFGEGIILLKEGEGLTERVQVDFKEHGKKFLVLQFAKLEYI